MDSLEHKVLKQCYSELVSCFGQSPDDITDSIIPLGILAPRDKSFLRNMQNDNEDKARKIVDIFLRRVQNNATVYQDLVNAMRKSGDWTKETICKLEEVRNSLKDNHCSIGGNVTANLVKAVPTDDGNHNDTGSGQIPNTSSADTLAIHTMRVDSITSNGEESCTQGNGTGASFVCKCGKCTLEQFIKKEGCFSEMKVKVPTKRAISFPYLDMSNLDEADRTDLKHQLWSETKNMIDHFARLLSKIEESLEQIQVSLDKIKRFILSLHILDKEDKQKLKSAKTLSEIFIVLCDYTSFYNHHIIDNIIEEHGSDEDKQRLQEYLKLFHSYCQRNIFEVPSHVLSTTSRKTAKVLVFKFTDSHVNKIDKVKDIELKIGEIAKIFCLRPSALQLCSIQSGCVELRFLISAANADCIFPVSYSQELALSEIGVSSVKLDDMEKATSSKKTFQWSLADFEGSGGFDVPSEDPATEYDFEPPHFYKISKTPVSLFNPIAESRDSDVPYMSRKLSAFWFKPKRPKPDFKDYTFLLPKPKRPKTDFNVESHVPKRSCSVGPPVKQGHEQRARKYSKKQEKTQRIFGKLKDSSWHK